MHGHCISNCTRIYIIYIFKRMHYNKKKVKTHQNTELFDLYIIIILLSISAT